MACCRLCEQKSPLISNELGVCIDCIRKHPQNALPLAEQAHAKSRKVFGLPAKPPNDPAGIPCNRCVNACRIPPGQTGFCGVRSNQKGKLTGVSANVGKLSWYHDPLPTNCVGDWICPGGTGAGYPAYAHCPGPERGYTNLAVFFHACSFNCLYCQNWHFKHQTFTPQTNTARNLVDDIDSKTACICFFGGDPTPQLHFALKASRIAIKENEGSILRICWETNGSMHARDMEQMVQLALHSGGCIKFDLKAWDENLHMALTGVTNKQTLANFKRIASWIAQRPIPPLLIASSLLVPGYIDEEEISQIAGFIASINPDIPYSLLAFHPQFNMSDMPLTSETQANRCLTAARQAGLSNARLGNIHLFV